VPHVLQERTWADAVDGKAVVDGVGFPPTWQLNCPLTTALSLSTTLSFVIPSVGWAWGPT